MQHSSRDIGAAFESLGCIAEVMIEPDDCSQFTGVAYARTIERFKPDLIVLINYSRASLAQYVPANLPVVTWVQDAMPHLFERGAGAAMGPLDLVVGHVHPQFFGHGGYPKDRALSLPVMASRRKFHAGPVGDVLRARFECEIACVTHHSQTYRELGAKMIEESAGNPGAGRLIETIMAWIPRIIENALGETFASQVYRAVSQALAENGEQPTPDRIALFSHQIAWPLLDRHFRHQTLQWAAAVAEEHGWRFHIYGRGWEGHAEFGRFAKGVLMHGDELRAAYQCAKVQLHASIHTNLHQRVMECALSGGLPLCRLTMDYVCNLGGYAAACLAHEKAATHQTAQGLTVAHAADHWTGMALCAQLQRLDLGAEGAAAFHIGEHKMPPGLVPIIDKVRDEPWGYNAGLPQPSELPWLLGDLAESTFWSKGTLRSRVQKAVECPVWRSDLSGGIAGRVARHLTYESAVRAILEKLERSIAPAAATATGAKS